MPAKKAPAKKAAQPSLDKLLQEIIIGRHDDRLADLFTVFRTRLEQKGGAVRWRLSWDDIVVDEDNLTLLECETAERLSGKSWITLSPTNSAHDCVSVLTAAVHHRREVTITEARAMLADLTVMDVADKVRSEYLAVPAPLDPPTSDGTSPSSD